MSILGKIFGRIFPQAKAAQPPTAPAGQAAPANTGTTTTTAQAPVGVQAPQPTQAGAATMDRVDVEQILDEKAAQKGQKLNWRTSIVDLMKLLDLDSSLQERKQLADELKYTGDKNDSAAMNIWLHKQVMKKLEENGGKVPADLKD
jgi:predicted aconitase